MATAGGERGMRVFLHVGRDRVITLDIQDRSWTTVERSGRAVIEKQALGAIATWQYLDDENDLVTITWCVDLIDDGCPSWPFRLRFLLSVIYET